jgi:nitric oxide dioxygenase
LTEDQIRIIEATAPVVAAHSLDITRAFYPHMFAENPEVFEFFNRANQATGKQPRALADALVGYASNIRRLEALGSAVERMVHKHVALQVPPSGYAIVGKHLMWAIHEVLGEAVTQEVHDAWVAAYTQLADILINAEKKLYEAQATADGGWSGYRSFVVKKADRTESGLLRLTLHPQDGGKVSSFVPGQYVSIFFAPDTVPGQEQEQHLAPRHYSIVSGDDSHLVVCVRHVEGGLISSHIHNTVSEGSVLKLCAPVGCFTLKEHTPEVPVVLVAGGVGFTPLLSMAEKAKANGNPVLFLHTVKHKADETFVSGVQADHKKTVVTGAGEPRITGAALLEWVRTCSQTPGAHFYMCAPAEMLVAVTDSLVAEGVPLDHIHYEVFGPHVQPKAS